MNDRPRATKVFVPRLGGGYEVITDPEEVARLTTPSAGPAGETVRRMADRILSGPIPKGKS